MSGILRRCRFSGSAKCESSERKNDFGVCGSLVSLFLVQTLIVSTCPFGATTANPLLNDICFLK